ncbi:MAG: TauD/TfdA family dioxygenase, partial [Acidobacteriota bacterium]|nr:TauD/TfdA family dioxygenase [Acidobacteriota bacterium]
MTRDPKPPSAGGKGAPTPLGGVRRAPVRLSEAELVRFAPLRSDGVLPILATRAVDGVDLIPWAERNRDALRSRLVENGAILFRGFEIGGPERFEQL